MKNIRNSTQYLLESSNASPFKDFVITAKVFMPAYLHTALNKDALMPEIELMC